MTTFCSDPEEILERWKSQNHEIEQILGRALGYPYYADDPKNFPGATHQDGVCVGPNTIECLAEQAAVRITKMEALLSDPAAVHLNMLRGTIAKPSFAQIKHLYPKEFEELEEQIRSNKG